ncbi:50S ribosomal protein L23 [Blattabacterium cuenoti]|uniref:50S ribosomal protein L23 n=1 Tax=Blattabacterium cuenoti TaxID=1653831 RepID=UPI00163BA789|nr:50S ribosomal protein L23 [Blattabacterium cuenoti]
MFIKLIVTDKSIKEGRTLNRYHFFVSLYWNRRCIKSKLTNFFGVPIKYVHTSVFLKKGKNCFGKKKVLSKTQNKKIKKIVVQFSGKKFIDFFQMEKEFSIKKNKKSKIESNGNKEVKTDNT